MLIGDSILIVPSSSLPYTWRVEKYMKKLHPISFANSKIFRVPIPLIIKALFGKVLVRTSLKAAKWTIKSIFFTSSFN